MLKLGHTRSSHKSDHYIQTPDTFIRAPLPGMMSGTAVVHAAPARGAGFVQYTAEMEAGGTLGNTELQRFVYVIEGEIEVQACQLAEGGYAYFPPGAKSEVRARAASSLVVVEKGYRVLDGTETPRALVGNEKNVSGQPLLGDRDIEVRMLLPDTTQFDFAVNTMTFQPGAALNMVEVHVMEHGLLFLEGGGIYRLGDSWYPVSAGDFIYMAPFCPQWFGALGKSPAKYLIYKDWNRHPIE
jgi:(S)-ureidoglycine aminohydrolase